MPKPHTCKRPKMDFKYGAKGIPVLFGHKTCVPRGHSSRVPREMGWLWTATDVPALKFDRHWRPGAVRRSVFLMFEPDSHLDVKIITKGKKKGTSNKSLRPSDSECSSEPGMQSTIMVQKKDGEINVAMRQLKNIGANRHISENPYEEDVLPYTFKVENDTPEKIAYRKHSKARKLAHRKQQLVKTAFSAVCREVYDKMDQQALQEAAAEHEECTCLFLEEQLIKNMVLTYMDKNFKPSDDKETSKPEQTFLDKLLNSIIEDPCHPGVASSKGSVTSEEEWRVEFTPPFAKYNPKAKKLETRHVEVQTMRPKSDDGGPVVIKEVEGERSGSLNNQFSTQS